MAARRDRHAVDCGEERGAITITLRTRGGGGGGLLRAGLPRPAARHARPQRHVRRSPAQVLARYHHAPPTHGGRGVQRKVREVEAKPLHTCTGGGCQYTVCCSTSSWTIWGGGHRFVVRCQYTVCCGTSSWTIWGGGHRFVVRCQYTVCCATSSWTIWGGGHRFVVGCQYTVCCGTSSWTIWGGGHRFVV
jgi:hypothetical protein